MRGAKLWIVFAVALAAVSSGCRKDKAGSASLSVHTTMPKGIMVTLVSLDRPGTYVERVKTDLGGTLNFTGVRPGKYELVYQFIVHDSIHTSVPYNYEESQPLEVNEGRNVYDWTIDGSIKRVDK